MKRRRFKQTESLKQRLTEQAEKLRKDAELTSPGAKRDKLIRQARQLEMAASIQDWLASPGLQAPR
jgi:hypothetical protein